VGYGLGGAVFHAPFIAVEPRLQLSAVVTRDSGRRAELARRYPDSAALDDVGALLAHIDDIDLVVVSTPNATHAPIAEAMLGRGRPVVVDKPVAPTPAEIRHLADLASRAGTRIVPFHNRRWDGDFRTVRHLAARGTLGSLQRFESRFERWQPRVPSGSQRAWKREVGPAAGIVYDLGTHIIDQAVVLFGRPHSVYAEIGIRRTGAEVDDDMFIALRYAEGPDVHLWASAVAADQGPRFRLLGSAGCYVKTGMDGQEAALMAGVSPATPGWGEEAPGAWGHLVSPDGSAPLPTLPGDYQSFYAGMAASLLDGTEPPVAVGDAITVAEIIEAARRSARSSAVVHLTAPTAT
jgi:predicted dehydrogenase